MPACTSVYGAPSAASRYCTIPFERSSGMPVPIKKRCLALACSALLSACQTLPGSGTRDETGGHLSAVALPVHSALAPATGRPTESGANDDLWSRIRAGMGVPPLEGEAAARVARHEQFYRRNRTGVMRTFARARPYLFEIVEAVEREGMPMEIALLPAVESAFIPHAHSGASADGLWQFMAPTGRRFSLKQHMFQDDRRNVRRATQAALTYLKTLHRRFDGDWQLAIAAYNCGEGCIEAARRIARSKGLAGRLEDLHLNEETSNYVPRLMALSNLVHASGMPDQPLPDVANRPFFAAVPIRRDIDVARAARLAGMSIDAFKTLNPQHKKPVIVAASNGEILVPVERRQAVIDGMGNSQGALSSWSVVEVRKRSSLESMAAAHGTSVALLRTANAVPEGHLVQAGSSMLVPRVRSSTEIPAHVAENAVLSTMPAMVATTVNVRRKDAWAGLAGRLGISLERLRGWNPHAVLKLRPGAIQLVLPVDIAERLAAARLLKF